MQITAIVVFLPIFKALCGEPSIKDSAGKEQSSILTFDTEKTQLGDQRDDRDSDDPNYAGAPPTDPADVGVEMVAAGDEGESPPGKRTFAKRRLSVATEGPPSQKQ